MKENSRYHIMLTGRVQGVGFRMFVQRNAKELGLTGWVRNVGYDQVETVAEGEPEMLSRFMNILQAGPTSSHVEEIKHKKEPANGEFNHFKIRYF